MSTTHAARTVYVSTVSEPGVSHRSGAPTNVLKRSDSNHKLGHGVWMKGAFKGMPLYSLTLEERATCQHDCVAWDICYGNNMPWATRFKHGDELTQRLEVELAALDAKHPNGYSVRLHILGDFYDVEYVRWWGNALSQHPLLHVYGYTHRTGEIGAAIDDVFSEYRTRFVIMQSDGTSALRPNALLETTPGARALPVCPKEAGKADSCLACGLCTLSYIKGVQFLLH